jgi:hypothetical protein
MKKHSSSNKLVIAATALLGYIALVAASRRWYLQWGATSNEIEQPLPGDEFMDHASANHAITIQAPVHAVWPWLKQIGQDKAGFYSYSFLENLVAADIHNADRIVPEWQHLKAGDTIRLGSKQVYGDTTLLPVVAMEENHYLVLKGWGAFVLKPIDSYTSRLLIRSHGKRNGWGMGLLSFLLLDPIHFLMERRMLIGLKERAERSWQQVT